MSSSYRLSEVNMFDGYSVNAFSKEVTYLKKLEPSRLLAGFYENAGLPDTHIRYKGWENLLIGGHTLGHYLTACAQAVSSAMIGEEDKKILTEYVKFIIDELLRCQANSQGKPGFVFGGIILDKDNVEQQFDMVEEGKTEIFKESWVPWYTLHKILAGVLSVYELVGYEPALKLASGIGDWSYDRASKWSEETHRTVLSIEYGGINDALYDLYKCTGKKEHLEAAHKFDDEDLFKRVASGEKNALNNVHANTTIPKFIGALNRYMTLGEEAKDFFDYAAGFWDVVVSRHTYATGGNSEWEHFGEDYVLDKERTNCNNETCNTYNMLKLSRNLFMITGDKKYADYYENTFINAILSSQNPETGMTMYFQPMATGYFKTYGNEFDKFWCCVGSGMENFTKLNSSIYFKDNEGIIVNMFFESEVTDKEQGVKLIQNTDLPKSDKTVFTVKLLDGKTSANFKLKLRIPDWTKDSSVKAEGKTVSVKDGYYVIAGEWADGDSVEYTLPCRITVKTLPDCDKVFAFKYGPVLLSANLGSKDMVTGTTGVDVTIPAEKIAPEETLVVKEGTVKEFVENINEHFEIDRSSMAFKLTGVSAPLEFGPHYLKYKERYGIYWYLEAGK